jgi:hypothetical protein
VHPGVQALQVDELDVLDRGRGAQHALDAPRAHEQLALLDDDLAAAPVGGAVAIDRDARTDDLDFHGLIVQTTCRPAQAWPASTRRGCGGRLRLMWSYTALAERTRG